MPHYQYSGIDTLGNKVSGWMNAASEPLLESRLRKERIWLLRAKQSKKRSGAGQFAGRKRRIKIRRRILVNFFLQLSLLLRAGITLPRALKRLAADFRSNPLGTVIEDLLRQVDSGVPFFETLQSYPSIFTSHMSAMVHAGELSGKLPDVIDELRRYLEWMDRLMLDIRQALLYPLIVFCASLAFMLMLFSFVVPRFVVVFESFSLKLPAITQLVMNVSGFIQAYWAIWLGIGFLFLGFLCLSRRIGLLGIFRDRLLMRIPLFGKLVQIFALSRFCNNLAMLYKAGIPLLKAIEICKYLVGNHVVRIALGEVHKGVKEGIPMSTIMSRYSVFTNTLVTVVSTGEASGNLDVAMSNLAAYYDELIPRQIKTVFSVFEPIMMLGLIGVVGVVAVSLILPIIQLWQSV